MYSLWWPKHIVPAHVSKVAKSVRVVCENIAKVHKFLILWWFKIWGDLIQFTHNHNYLMGTITFEVHHITPTSPRNMLTTIFKSILIFFAFHVLCIFFFLNIPCMGIYREKRNTQLCKPKTSQFCYAEHTDVIRDWRALVVR